MRDANRLKDRYEFSLDTRHVVSLTVVGLIALVGVFSLGVLVGKRNAPAPAPGEPVDVLAALDEKADAPDASLTFQHELTRKAPQPPPPVIAKVEPKVEAKPEPRVEAKTEGNAETRAETKPDLNDTIAKAAKEPSTESDAPAAPAASPTPAPAVASAPSPAIAPPPSAPAPRVAEGPAKDLIAKDREIVPTRTLSNDAGGLAAALQRAQRPPTAPPSTGGGFTLQLSAYQDRAEAEKYAASVKAKGYSPYLVEANVPGKGVWFRVRLGHFATREVATKYQSDFKRETQLQSMVTGE